MSTTPTNGSGTPLLQLENVTAFYGEFHCMFSRERS